MTTFNILIVGDAAVGKSTYINMLKTGNFEKRYLPTSAGSVQNIPRDIFEGMHNTLCFFESNTTDSTQWPPQVDGVIVMFDVTFERSVRNVQKYIDEAWLKYGEVKMVVCGNKIDVEGREIKPTYIRRKRWYRYYMDISAKSRYNFEKPIDKLMGHSHRKTPPPQFIEPRNYTPLNIRKF